MATVSEKLLQALEKVVELSSPAHHHPEVLAHLREARLLVDSGADGGAPSGFWEEDTGWSVLIPVPPIRGVRLGGRSTLIVNDVVNTPDPPMDGQLRYVGGSGKLDLYDVNLADFHRIGGGIKVDTVTADMSVNGAHGLLNVDATAGPVTLTLIRANATAGRSGTFLVVVKVDASANGVTVNPDSFTNVDGGPVGVGFTLVNRGDYRLLVYADHAWTSWLTLARSP